MDNTARIYGTVCVLPCEISRLENERAKYSGPRL